MKRIFGLVLSIFLMLAPLTALAEIAQPKLPVSIDRFQWVKRAQWQCGESTTYIFEENADVAWYAIFLNRQQFPNAFAVGRVTTNSREDWLDNNRDGVFDEYFTDLDALHQQYPRICDAVR